MHDGVNLPYFLSCYFGDLCVAEKAVAFLEALQSEYNTYQKQVIKNAKVLAVTLQEEGITIVSGGTDNHLVLVNTDSVGITGKESEKVLESARIQNLVYK